MFVGVLPIPALRTHAFSLPVLVFDFFQAAVRSFTSLLVNTLFLGLCCQCAKYDLPYSCETRDGGRSSLIFEKWKGGNLRWVRCCVGASGIQCCVGANGIQCCVGASGIQCCVGASGI